MRLQSASPPRHDLYHRASKIHEGIGKRLAQIAHDEPLTPVSAPLGSIVR
jgi:hypothetical protein